MDFIERLFGVSPDNGDGTTEILWLVVLAVLLLVAFGRTRHLYGRRRIEQRRLVAHSARPEQLRFTSFARTAVDDQQAVLVTGNVDVAHSADLVDAIVLLDGTYCIVEKVISLEKLVRKGEPLMMRVRKL